MKKSAFVSLLLICSSGLLVAYNEWSYRAGSSRVALSILYDEPALPRDRIDRFQLLMHDRLIDLDNEIDQIQHDEVVQRVLGTFEEPATQPAALLLAKRFDTLDDRIGYARWEGLLELEDSTDADWEIRKQATIDLAAELERDLRSLRKAIFPFGLATSSVRSQIYDRDPNDTSIPLK